MSKTKSNQQRPSDEDEVIEVTIAQCEHPCGRVERQFAIVRKIRGEDGKWTSTSVFDECDLPVLKQAIKDLEKKLLMESMSSGETLN